MNKDLFKIALEHLRKTSPKRNFAQSVDLIINIKDVDIKQTADKVDFFTELPKPSGKQPKVCAFVGAELIEHAKQVCDLAILNDDFRLYDKKKQKKLALTYEYFIAQASIMPEVAKVFGRALGPKGKMPNPKAGCVVPPNANLVPLIEKLRKTVRIRMKGQL